MALAAEYVAGKGELACLVRRESNTADLARQHVVAHAKGPEVESMFAISGRDLEHDWLTLFQGD